MSLRLRAERATQARPVYWVVAVLFAVALLVILIHSTHEGGSGPSAPGDASAFVDQVRAT